jgi:hypothetical protein
MLGGGWRVLDVGYRESGEEFKIEQFKIQKEEVAVAWVRPWGD